MSEDDPGKRLNPTDVGEVIAVETATQYVVGRLAGYHREKASHRITLWFEHADPVVLTVGDLNVIRWNVPERRQVEGTGPRDAVWTADAGLG